MFSKRRERKRRTGEEGGFWDLMIILFLVIPIFLVRCPFCPDLGQLEMRREDGRTEG